MRGDRSQPSRNGTGARRSAPRRRLSVRGRFLHAGPERVHVRGFTYGPFAPGPDGEPFPDEEPVRSDFDAMTRVGANALRTYTVPPRRLLDAAYGAGLRVMVGIPWEQHVAFLDEPGLSDAIEETVRLGVRACRGHPAVLCYAVGNEIPSQIVRWSGRRRIERHIRRLCEAAREEDPSGLVTYVNYPSTEYLELDFLDLVAFNVYLESVERLEAYLKRLHNLAGDRPLLMGELGLDSGRHGEGGQAWGLDAQIRAVSASGCAGSFVFAWTDEWHAGGREIESWRFGVTDRERRPKPALPAVRRAFEARPVPEHPDWPLVTVVVCAFNAEETLADCLEGATRLDYPNVEVLVVDDGSTDRTAEIARRFAVTLLQTPNEGLSKARNTGIRAARGEIIAFTDADARPDPEWLRYLVAAFEESEYAGIGGPNLAPAGDGPVADSVACAPGGPIHVLLSDDEAEHIPGCNMAFRREALGTIGMFDPRFRVAGDDVDVCWRLQDAGMSLGFCPSAMVWHHPRPTVRAYWRQQRGYGRAEALLEEKWPEKYNSAGHVTWGGRVYGGSRRRFVTGRSRVYHGVWGEAPYQTAQPGAPGILESLAAMPEWFLVLGALFVVALLGITWSPLLAAIPLLIAAIAPVVYAASSGARRARFPTPALDAGELRRRRCLTAWLHVIQPLARLRGRLLHGLTPWRLRAARRFAWPARRTAFVWSERWTTPAARLLALERHLRRIRAPVVRGGPFDRWDLEVKGGLAGRVRVHACTEEHGTGRQLVRLRFVPSPTVPTAAMAVMFAALATWAAVDGPPLAAAVLAAIGATALVRAGLEAGAALSAALEAVDHLEPADAPVVESGDGRTGPASDRVEDSPTRPDAEIALATQGSAS